MILYLDSSALMKRYVLEPGSKEVVSLLKGASLFGTALITRAEIASALTRAARKERISQKDATRLITSFRRDWHGYFAIQITEAIVRDADYLAVEYALRGYDAVQLSCALAWREQLEDGADIRFATFDDRLWDACQSEGLAAFPSVRPSEFLAVKRSL